MNCNPLCLILLLAVIFGGNDCGCGCGYDGVGRSGDCGRDCDCGCGGGFGRIGGLNGFGNGNYCEILFFLLIISWIFGGNYGSGGYGILGRGNDCGCGC